MVERAAHRAANGPKGASWLPETLAQDLLGTDSGSGCERLSTVALLELLSWATSARLVSAHTCSRRRRNVKCPRPRRATADAEQRAVVSGPHSPTRRESDRALSSALLRDQLSS